MNPVTQGKNCEGPAVDDDLRAAIEQVLAALAELAIAIDLSIQEFAEVAKSAFVVTAAKRATRAAGTVNRSRIAAITGLSRSDVTQLLSLPNNRDKRGRRSRARRIMDAWSDDGLFLDERNRPRALPLRGRKGSFEQLVRMYAGDIPPKAMLDRLLHLSLVAVLPGSRSAPQRVIPIKRARARVVEQHLAVLMSMLAKLMQAKSTGVATTISTLFLPARNEAEEAIMARAIEERASVFISGMRAAFPVEKKNGYGITLLLATMHNQPLGSLVSANGKSKRRAKPEPTSKTV